jgi:predicted metal-binding protein
LTSHENEILICVDCGHKKGQPEKALPAKKMRETLIQKMCMQGMTREDARKIVRAAPCMGFCEQHEVVVFQGEGRETLAFGPLTPDRDENDVLSGFELYCSRPRGHKLIKDERPEALKQTVLVRIPPRKSDG